MHNDRHTDLKPLINKYIQDKWQHSWNFQTQNKHHEIFPIIPPQSTLPSSFYRKYQILFNRLRIGHIRLAPSCLIDHTNLHECNHCNQLLSQAFTNRMQLLYANLFTILSLY